MTSTKAKLEFTHAMARHTRATVRQCEALMRYAGTLWRLERDHSLGSVAKRERIRRKVMDMCGEIISVTNGTCCMPVFTGAVLKIRVPSGWSNSFDGEGIVVPG